MQLLRHALLALALLCSTAATLAADEPPPQFERAVNVLHSYGGSGNQLEQVNQTIMELKKSHPDGGWSQALQAEMLATFSLGTGEGWVKVFDQVLRLSDEALRLNPQLAVAYTAKGKALLHVGQFAEANACIDAALAIDPNMASAVFLRGDVYRYSGDLEKAELAYRRFIELAPTPERKSNGYSWLASMHFHAAYTNVSDRPRLLASAKDAYEQSLILDPKSAWKTVNYAIFLNDLIADFNGAEQQALKALKFMEFPMARYHLAAARYQRLWQQSAQMTPTALRQSATAIAASSRIDLAQALEFDFDDVVRGRLTSLQSRLR